MVIIQTKPFGSEAGQKIQKKAIGILRLNVTFPSGDCKILAVTEPFSIVNPLQL
jgi:hypothetical protein